MKILCFGDSITWGYTPQGGRYAHPWPAAVQEYRKHDTIINAGQPGRTAYGSKRILSSLLQQYLPDITCIMLGSNDLSLDCGSTIEMVIQDLQELGKEACKYGNVILLAPPSIDESVDPGWHYMPEIASDMKELADQISILCQKQNWYFFNTQKLVKPAVPDGLHIDQNSHMILGRAIATFLTSITS